MMRMEFRGLWFLSFMLAVGTAATHAQSAAPVQAGSSANMPGPISAPKLLSQDDRAIPQCKGLGNAEVKLEFVLTIDGDAKNIRVIESPSEAYGACAIEMLRGWKYLPAMRDGKPVEIKMVLTMNVSGKA